MGLEQVSSIQRSYPFSLQIGVTAEQAQDSMTQANEQLRVDVEKWKSSKDKELAEILVNWSDNQIQYHERVSPSLSPQ